MHRRRASGAVMVGIRPEHVQLGDGGLAARIEDLEPHGRETIYHLDSPLGPLHALEAGAVARFRVGRQGEVRVAVPRLRRRHGGAARVAA